MKDRDMIKTFRMLLRKKEKLNNQYRKNEMCILRLQNNNNKIFEDLYFLFNSLNSFFHEYPITTFHSGEGDKE